MAQQDNESEEQAIHPFSEIDAEIASVILDIIEQRGWTDLSDILKEYKRQGDGVILDKLSEYSASIEVDDDEGMEQPSKKDFGATTKREFVSIGSHTFRTFALFNFRRTRRWAEKVVYCIIVNESPMPGSAQWYVDTVIDFESESERDSEWVSLQNKMKKQNCVFL